MFCMLIVFFCPDVKVMQMYQQKYIGYGIEKTRFLIIATAIITQSECCVHHHATVCTVCKHGENPQKD